MVDWYALQVGLELTASDVLILLDSCCAAAASNLQHENNSNRGGRTEIVAACGYDQTTNGGAFTRALIRELRRRAENDSDFDKCFSVAQLYQGLLASILRKAVPRDEVPGRFGVLPQNLSTPVYMSLNNDFNQASIPLKRFPPREVRSRASSTRTVSSFSDQPTQDPPEDEDPTKTTDIRDGLPPFTVSAVSGDMDSYNRSDCPDFMWDIHDSLRRHKGIQRIRMAESGELTFVERKTLEDEPDMSFYDVTCMMREVETRVGEKRQAKIALSSHFA